MNRTVTIYHRRLFGKNNNYLLNGNLSHNHFLLDFFLAEKLIF